MNGLFRPCLVVAMVLVFCGQALAQTKPAPARVRVVTPPLTNYAPLIVARDNGWFDEENLAVSWSTVTQTAVSIEAVYGGSAEFGGGGILEPMIARGNGLDVMLAVPTARIRSSAPDNSGIAVRANSEIREPADLTGKEFPLG